MVKRDIAQAPNVEDPSSEVGERAYCGSAWVVLVPARGGGHGVGQRPPCAGLGILAHGKFRRCSGQVDHVASG